MIVHACGVAMVRWQKYLAAEAAGPNPKLGEAVHRLHMQQCTHAFRHWSIHRTAQRGVGALDELSHCTRMRTALHAWRPCLSHALTRR